MDQPLPMPRFEPERLDRAFEVLAEQVARGDLPAGVLAVAGPDGLIRVEAFAGLQDGPITVEHRFRVASVTKPIVATAVMRLVESGRLILGAPVSAYLPGFAPAPPATGGPGGEAITTWHLLTHTSGAGDRDITSGGPPPSAADLLTEVSSRPLRFVPGAAYHYASDTFFVLAELVRTLGDMPSLAAALQAWILEPLGMTATGFDSERAGWPAAPGHLVGRPDAVAAVLSRWFDSVEHPGGGLWSTAADLVAFGRAMLQGGRLGDVRILGKPFVRLMTLEQTAGLPEDGSELGRRSGYGLGWSKPTAAGRMPGSPEAFDHRGASGSRLLVDPGYGLVIALLANLWDAPAPLSDAVVAAVYGALEA